MNDVIHIAAALIDDGEGRVMLVRKTGTRPFMQAGGKIEDGEDAWAALRRELAEEIGLNLPPLTGCYLGRFKAIAANESETYVLADLFHVRTSHAPMASAEIAEAIWFEVAKVADLPLAPLTREIVIPIALKLTPSPAPPA